MRNLKRHVEPKLNTLRVSGDFIDLTGSFTISGSLISGSNLSTIDNLIQEGDVVRVEITSSPTFFCNNVIGFVDLTAFDPNKFGLILEKTGNTFSSASHLNAALNIGDILSFTMPTSSTGATVITVDSIFGFKAIETSLTCYPGPISDDFYVIAFDYLTAVNVPPGVLAFPNGSLFPGGPVDLFKGVSTTTEYFSEIELVISDTQVQVGDYLTSSATVTDLTVYYKSYINSEFLDVKKLRTQTIVTDSQIERKGLLSVNLENFLNQSKGFRFGFSAHHNGEYTVYYNMYNALPEFNETTHSFLVDKNIIEMYPLDYNSNILFIEYIDVPSGDQFVCFARVTDDNIIFGNSVPSSNPNWVSKFTTLVGNPEAPNQHSVNYCGLIGFRFNLSSPTPEVLEVITYSLDLSTLTLTLVSDWFDSTYSHPTTPNSFFQINLPRVFLKKFNTTYITFNPYFTFPVNIFNGSVHRYFFISIDPTFVSVTNVTSLLAYYDMYFYNNPIVYNIPGSSLHFLLFSNQTLRLLQIDNETENILISNISAVTVNTILSATYFLAHIECIENNSSITTNLSFVLHKFTVNNLAGIIPESHYRLPIPYIDNNPSLGFFPLDNYYISIPTGSLAKQIIIDRITGKLFISYSPSFSSFSLVNLMSFNNTVIGVRYG
ncbi:MAG: hypothetical protein ABIK31_07235, partial [candidate division WOR-3 bacterium]